MDWGFVNLVDEACETCRIACFCMVCHHCGTCYLELFPNARQSSQRIHMPAGPPKRCLQATC